MENALKNLAKKYCTDKNSLHNYMDIYNLYPNIPKNFFNNLLIFINF